MSIVSDFLQKQKYTIKVFYNGIKIFSLRASVKGQNSIQDKNRRLAYLLPEKMKPTLEGSNHTVIYDVADACPMADLKDIVPELVSQFSKQISDEIIDGITDLIKTPPASPDEQRRISEYNNILAWVNEVQKRIDAKPPEGGFSSETIEDLNKKKEWLKLNKPPAPKLNPDDEKQYDRIVLWLKAHEGTALLYNLWRWGYLQKEIWYQKLRNKNKIDTLVFPTKLQRVGLDPKYLFEREQSAMVPDVLRRPESKWGWVEGPITALIIVVGLVLIVWKFVG